jgi:hypothetical protein
MAWRVKDWLWLAVALAAATLAAGTSGTAAEPAARATAVEPACSSTTFTGQPEAGTMLTKSAARWHDA